MFLLKCLFLNLLLLQSTQVFANKALERVTGADTSRTGYYNPNPEDGRIPGQTDIILEEFSKRPSSETADPTQKKQMVQAIVRTATIHSRYKDAVYQQPINDRERNHFRCMQIIRNVSNYLIDETKETLNILSNPGGDFKANITPRMNSVRGELEELTRLSKISESDFINWFVEAVSDLHGGLVQDNRWHWHDHEDRPAVGGLKPAGAGGGGSVNSAPASSPLPSAKAAAVAPTTIRDSAGNELPLDKEEGVYAAFVLVKSFGRVDDIKDSLDQYIKSVNGQLLHRADLSKPAYINNLYDQLSAIYEAEAAAVAAPIPAPAPVPAPVAAGGFVTMDDFTYTGEVGKNFDTIIAAHGDPSLTIMSVYDPSELNIHSQYGQLTEIGMRLAFIDWEASQLNKPKNGYLGADAGFYVFNIETERTLDGGRKELVSTTDLPPEQKQHMTAENFYQNAEQAFAKGFNSYAGVVRSSSLRSGHFFTLFVRKEADGTWEVFAINPLGKPESLLSVTAEVLAPFVTYLTSKGIRIKTQKAVATGFQMRNETCGIWATLIARALCAVGSIEGLNKFYDLLVSTDASMQSLANINAVPAQAIGLADVVKYRTLRLLAEEKSDRESTLEFYNGADLLEAQRQIAALTQSINAVAQELANKFGVNYEQLLADQKNVVEQKLITMERNFAEYYAELLRKVLSFSQENPVNFGNFREGQSDEKKAEEDARVAPGIKAFHDGFVQYLATTQGR